MRTRPLSLVETEGCFIMVSGACLRERFHACSYQFITALCHGRCCEGSLSRPLNVSVHESEEAELRRQGAKINAIQERMIDMKAATDWRFCEKTGEKHCVCGKFIHFVRTPRGKTMPIDPETGVCHFETCTQAQKFKRQSVKKEA